MIRIYKFLDRKMQKISLFLYIRIYNTIVSDAAELANAWQSKVKCLFADAKELAGGFLNGDRQFKTKLSELSEQYKQYK